MKETTITNNNNNNNNKNNNNNSNRNKSWGTAAAPREHRKADAKVQKKGVHGCEIKETGSGVKKKRFQGRRGLRKEGVGVNKNGREEKKKGLEVKKKGLEVKK